MRPGIYNIAKKAAVLAVVLPCLFAGTSAYAANSTNTMKVRLQVATTCALNVADLNFGTVAQVLGTETATSLVTVNCTPGTVLAVCFQPVFSVANTSKNSTMTSAAGGTVNFSMALQGWFGVTAGYTYINGKLFAAPGAAPGSYKSVETLYVIY